jgi:putative MATE family efflux protein
MQDDSTARFVTGSTLRHVIVMTLTGAVGLMTMFAADLADLYYLSLLGDVDVTAAIGFAGVLSFANLSLSIGSGIAASALVARSLGAKNLARAREFATSSLAFTLLVSAFYTLMIAAFAPALLRFLGAHERALELAQSYIYLLTPGFVMLAGAVACAFALRGIGDAYRAMLVTLSSATATFILDPIFIFGLGLGIQGAAFAHVIANAMALGLGLHGLAIKHRFLDRFSLSGLRRDLQPIIAIALPAMLTQLATPFTVAYTTWIVAPYGEEAVSANAIIGRIVPVAFGIIFSLSGAVGPIIGQNFGAGQFTRVRRALIDSMGFALAYTLTTSLLLFLFRQQIADAFLASGRTRELIVFFCNFVAVSWAFVGAQFVAQAAFNNLGRPALSTWFNWGKASLGTIPFAMVGSAMAGVEGIMLGLALGSVIFGIASTWWAFKLTQKLELGSRHVHHLHP